MCWANTQTSWVCQHRCRCTSRDTVLWCEWNCSESAVSDFSWKNKRKNKTDDVGAKDHRLSKLVETFHAFFANKTGRGNSWLATHAILMNCTGACAKLLSFFAAIKSNNSKKTTLAAETQSQSRLGLRFCCFRRCCKPSLSLLWVQNVKGNE